MKSWPHGPYHQRLDSGLLIVTSSVYRNEPILGTPAHRTVVVEKLKRVFEESAHELHAYVVLANHYHVLFHRPDEAPDLSHVFRRLHRACAIEVNKLDGVAERRLFYQYWDSAVRRETSYLARINYIHQNSVRHGYCKHPGQWDASSYSWFVSTAPNSFVQTVESFKTDLVDVFEPGEV